MDRIFSAILAAAAVAFAQDVSQQAASAMRAGRYAEAEALYRQLVRTEPKDPGWRGNLGLALYSQGKLREAATALTESLKLRPSPGLSVVLGLTWLKLSEPCKAIGPLERSDRREALADAYYGCGRYPEAARTFTSLGDLRHAARSFWRARDYPQAKPIYDKLAPQYGTEPDFAYEYGDTLLRSEGAEPAIPWLERAKSIAEGRAALGKAYAEAGRYAEAIPHLEASVKADPDLLLPLSRAYKATGRAAEAERALKEYRSRQSGQY